MSLVDVEEMQRRFYDTLFHTCLYRTGMGLPEPGLSPVHRVFWGPQDARVTHLSMVSIGNKVSKSIWEARRSS